MADIVNLKVQDHLGKKMMIVPVVMDVPIEPGIITCTPACGEQFCSQKPGVSVFYTDRILQDI